MVARLLRLAVFALVMLAALWAWWWLGRAAPWVAVVGAVLIACGSHALVLALEFPLMHLANRQDPAPRARIGEVVSAWWNECRVGLLTFAWLQPFRARAEPDHLPGQSADQRGVLFVHGFVCNRGMWNPWMRRLRARGVPFIAVNLEPPFGSIDGYAPIIGQAVKRLRAHTGLAPVVVCHSMGGLATRAWLRTLRNTAPDSADVLPLHAVITIGTPHRGTAISPWNPLANVKQMRHLGPWIAALGATEPPELRRRFVCFYSHCDNIAFPASTATLADADNRHLRGTAHMQLIERPEVFEAMMEKLGAVKGKA